MVLADFAQYVGGWVRRALGIAAAMLPVRLWPVFEEHVPVSDSALLAALATFLAGAAIGISGFIHFTTEQASRNTQIVLETAVSNLPGAAGVTTAMPVGMTALSLFAFLLLTPQGWATMYLGLTGFVRILGATFDDPRGDWILSVLDGALMRAFRTTQSGNQRWQRARLEGPDVADRVVPGTQIGLPHADLVIVAARRKPEWNAGTVVITSDTAYRVGDVSERTIDGWLRTLYPLTEHKDLEVYRRMVRYEMPPRA